VLVNLATFFGKAIININISVIGANIMDKTPSDRYTAWAE